MSGVKRFEAHYLTEGVMGGKALACAEMVLASDYDALSAECERLRNQWTDAEPAGADVRGRIVAAYGAGKWLAEFDALVAERDELRALLAQSESKRVKL